MLFLSKSKLNSYIQCPEKYRIGYELGIRPLRATSSFIEGRAIHHLIESKLMANGNSPDVLEEASQIFWKVNPFESCDYASKKNYKAAQVKCLYEAKRFLELMGPLKVRDIEFPLKAPLVEPFSMEEISDVLLRGYVDFLDIYEGKPRIVDIKTMSKKPMVGMASLAFELTVYAYLLAYPYIYMDMDPVPVALLNLIRKKEPDISWDKSTRSFDDFVELVHTVSAIANNIFNGIFYKNPGMHCSWCQNKPFCFGDKEKAVAVFGKDALQLYMSGGFTSQDIEHAKAIYC